MAMPAGIICNGYRVMTSFASLSIMPHSGVGGCTPNPRKDNAEIIRITLPVSSVVRTKSSPAVPGNRCRIMILMDDPPATLANRI